MASQTVVIAIDDRQETPMLTPASQTALRVLATLARWSLLGLFLLLPLAFVPWTTEAFEVNKQMVLLVLGGIATVGWLASMVLSQTLRLRGGWLNVLPAAFLVAVFASGIFSSGGFVTWWGGASQEYTSVMTVAMFVMVFYVLANTSGWIVSLRSVVGAILLSASVVGLVSVLGLFDLYHLPFAVSAGRAFTTVGSLNMFVLFELVVMFLGLTAWLTWPVVEGAPLLAGRIGILLRGMILWVTIVALLGLLGVDFWVFWILAIFGILLVLCVGFLKGEEFPRPTRFLLPFAVLIVSGLFLFLPSPLQFKDLPVTVSPSYQSSWDITRQTLSENTTRLLFGSGPGTFSYNYAQYKTESVNESAFWAIQFDRAKSHLLTLLATFGIAPLTLLVLFGVVLGLQAASRLAFERHLGDWKMVYVLGVPWAVTGLAHVLYASNMTMSFLLWALSGLLASQVLLRVREASFARAPRLALLVSFVFVFVIVSALGVGVLTVQRYQSEVAFAKAAAQDSAGASASDVIETLTQATKGAAPLQNDTVYRNLAASYLIYASDLIAAAGTAPNQEQLQLISQAAASSVNAGKMAVQLGSNNVINWVVLGAIYRDLMPFAAGAEDFAAAAFERAVALEPVNPAHHTDLGRVYLAVADRATQLKTAEDAELAAQAQQAEVTQLDEAEASFEEAIRLKPDYAPAHYYLAAVFERQGKLEDAEVRLEALSAYRPVDIGLGFQLAMLRLRLEDLNGARAELERLLTLSPTYSNALWYLSDIAEQQGNVELALSYAQKVLELNPESEVARNRVQALQAGTTPAEEPLQPLEVDTL